MIKKRIYFSHYIRGPVDHNPTSDELRAYKQAAKFQGTFFGRLFPHTMDVYIPAEHEDFVGIAYKDKYLTIDQILEIDCKIIDTCDVIIFFAPDGCKLSHGMQVEQDYAIAHDKQIYTYDKLTHIVINDVYHLLDDMQGV